MYPQSNGSLAIVDIDASKGLVDLWVHLFVAIEDIHRMVIDSGIIGFRLNSNRLEAKSEKGPRNHFRGGQNVRRCHPCQFTRLTLGEHVLPG